jgi:hypothetical protein
VGAKATKNIDVCAHWQFFFSESSGILEKASRDNRGELGGITSEARHIVKTAQLSRAFARMLVP